MTQQTKRAVIAVVTACSVLLAGAFAPQQPKAAWWCTAFSVTCNETAAPSENGNSVTFRCKLVDWWYEITG
ncbi:MAG TPA: hypothetical protein H9845_08890 [Candidatus Agathobaculum pullicola]|nr:hypothetical protein [Candidatus Agathobaculum pullicola]